MGLETDNSAIIEGPGKPTPSPSTAAKINPNELTPVSVDDKKVPLNADPLYKLCTDPGPLPVKNANELFCSQNATTGVPLGK